MRGRVGMVATLASVVLLLAGCTGGVVSGRASLARSSTIPSPAAATCPGSDGLSGAMSDYGDRRPFPPVRPARLPADGAADIAGVHLVGRRVGDQQHPDRPPVIWETDAAVPDLKSCWLRLLVAYPETGLYPVVLDAGDDPPGGSAWLAEDVDASSRTDPARLGRPEVLLPKLYRDAVDEDGDPNGNPFGSRFPGLFTTAHLLSHAAAAVTNSWDLRGRLGLVPAARPADVPYAIGWLGATNYFDAGYITAVARSWEDRFGAQLMAMGFDYVAFAVAAPPQTLREAERVAAEHLALCPDELLQGDYDNFVAYSDSLIGQPWWSCWWD